MVYVEGTRIESRKCGGVCVNVDESSWCVWAYAFGAYVYSRVGGGFSSKSEHLIYLVSSPCPRCGLCSLGQKDLSCLELFKRRSCYV
jgi:hypothetical protein